MKTFKSLAIVLGFSLVLLSSTLMADEWDKETKVTFSGPVQIQDTKLAAGTYVFKLADTADRHVVQIFNQDQTQVLATIIAIPDYRVTPTDNTVVKFAENGESFLRRLEPCLRVAFPSNSGFTRETTPVKNSKNFPTEAAVQPVSTVTPVRHRRKQRPHPLRLRHLRHRLRRNPLLHRHRPKPRRRRQPLTNQHRSLRNCPRLPVSCR